MKKALITALIVSVLLISIVAGTHFNLVKANPYLYREDGEVAQPPDAIYPILTISSMKNDTVYRENHVSVNFNITIIMPPRPVYFVDNAMWFSGVYYKANWLSNNTNIDIEEYLKSIPPEKILQSDSYRMQFGTDYIYEGRMLSHSFTINLTRIPEGLNYLEVFAVEKGYKEAYRTGNTIYYGEYELLGSSMVNFTVDTTPPNILNISLTNTTYNSAIIPLSFNVNETASQTMYSLDNQANITIQGNTTLAGLAEGSHSLVVYANDTAGNMGKSDTVFFTVKLPPQAPIFSMPKEYLNYTIASRNGAPWAIIDGTYPIYCSNAEKTGNIPMVYPTPPNTQNITIKLNGTQLNWTNLTETNPAALHHTALGDWSMIETDLQPINFFILTIHYEHTIESNNGSYRFLYDLNISPYLSPSSPNSTAYFNLKMEEQYSNLQVYTIPSDNITNPLEYAVQKAQKSGNPQEVTFEVTSEYSKPLPGDVLVTFQVEASAQNQDFPTLAVTVTIITLVAGFVIIGLLAYFAKHKDGSKLRKQSFLQVVFPMLFSQGNHFVLQGELKAT